MTTIIGWVGGLGIVTVVCFGGYLLIVQHGRDLESAEVSAANATVVAHATQESATILSQQQAKLGVDEQQLADAAAQMETLRNVHASDQTASDVVFDNSWASWLQRDKHGQPTASH